MAKKAKQYNNPDRKNVPRILLFGLQYKSIEKLRLLAELLNQLEVEFGIMETEISMKDCFICNDITQREVGTLDRSGMEKLVRKLITRMLINDTPNE